MLCFALFGFVLFLFNFHNDHIGSPQDNRKLDAGVICSTMHMHH